VRQHDRKGMEKLTLPVRQAINSININDSVKQKEKIIQMRKFIIDS
jgi:hypothetical protein